MVGRRRYQRLRNHSDVRVVGVCDRKLNGTDFVDDGIPAMASYTELLDSDIDVLVVAMSNDMTAKVTEAALRAGKHVLCEKPPARNLQEFLPVVQSYVEHPTVKVMYGFNHRHHDSVREAQHIIGSGILGDLISMRGIYGKSQIITFDQSDWRTQREIAGGGVLLDQGIHMVDLMRLFAGHFHYVESIVSNSFWNFDVEDNAYALLRSESGVVAMLHSSATQWRHRFSLDINLEKGAVQLSGLLTGSKSYGDETLTVIDKSQPRHGEPWEKTTRFTADPSWQREVDLFIDAISSNSSIETGGVADALETLALVQGIYYADRNWRTFAGIHDPEPQAARMRGMLEILD